MYGKQEWAAAFFKIQNLANQAEISANVAEILSRDFGIPKLNLFSNYEIPFLSITLGLLPFIVTQVLLIVNNSEHTAHVFSVKFYFIFKYRNYYTHT